MTDSFFTVGQKIWKSPYQKNSWNQLNQFHEIFFDQNSIICIRAYGSGLRGGGTDFPKIPKFSQKMFRGEIYSLVPTLSPPPWFALRGGQFFMPRGDQSGTRRLRGGLSPLSPPVCTYDYMPFQKWPKINFWTGKKLKLSKMQFHEKNNNLFDFTSFFLVGLDFFQFSGPLLSPILFLQIRPLFLFHIYIYGLSLSDFRLIWAIPRLRTVSHHLTLRRMPWAEGGLETWV